MRTPTAGLAALAAVFMASAAAAQQPPTIARIGEPAQIIDSLPAPESVTLGPDGRWYVSTFGPSDSAGDGAVWVVDPATGAISIHATGLDDPCGLVFVGDTLWVADRKGLYRVAGDTVQLVYGADAFPRPLGFLNDLAVGSDGALYLSDTGNPQTRSGGAIYRIAPGRKPALVPGSETVRNAMNPNGLFVAASDSIYAVDFASGVLIVTDGRGTWREVATGLGAPDGIAEAGAGAFYVTDNRGGDLFRVGRAPGSRAEKLASGFKSPADLAVDGRRGLLLVPEKGADRVVVYRLQPKAGTR